MRSILMFSVALPALLMAAADKSSGSTSSKAATAESLKAQKAAQTGDVASQRAAQTGEAAQATPDGPAADTGTPKDAQEAANVDAAQTQANRVAREPEAGSDALPPNVEVRGEANPAPATAADVEASGAIIEPSIKDAIDVDHESVDNNPRAGTSALQNAVDWNDANRRTPADRDFAGQGLDPAPYGTAAKD